MLAANATLAPGYAKGLAGIARSMPTSAAADRVAAKLGVHLTRHRRAGSSSAICSTPDTSRCAARKVRNRSDHVREKDGVWAVLLWLNILAARRQSCRGNHRASIGRLRPQLLFAPRLRGARDAAAEGADERSAERLPGPGRAQRRGADVAKADDFSYTDPVDGAFKNQGIRVMFEDGSRIVYRLSGTGPGGDPAGLYRALRGGSGALAQDTQAALSDLIATSRDFARLTEFTGREQADVIT